MILASSRFMLALPLLALLAACGEETPRPVSTRPAATRPGRNHQPTPPAALYRNPPPAARAQSLPGLEGVIGADTRELTRLFGTPRLDVIEGDARKLQFSGTPCVLDIYLYPPAPGQVPRATYVDARRSGDARDVDRAACVASLKKR